MILAAPEAREDVKTGVHAIVEEGTAQDADGIAARGLVASGGEWMREAAEAVARQKKAQQKRNRALAAKGGDLLDDVFVKPLGPPLHVARKFEGPMRRLSAGFPNRTGWAARWHDETFGAPDDPDRKGSDWRAGPPSPSLPHEGGGRRFASSVGRGAAEGGARPRGGAGAFGTGRFMVRSLLTVRSLGR